MPVATGASTQLADSTGSDGKRFVFIGGLHRSGTTPLARWMGQHPEVSSFSDTGVHADEGQHLQDVYPSARRFGGPGRFALRPGSYLTENSDLVSEESRRRLWSAWAPHWDLSRPVLLEKSPPNLVRTRFLEALFPRSRFVIVIRHPLAVAYATRKWVRGMRLRTLLRHWVVAHERCLEDAASVERLAFVHYETLITDPVGTMAEVFRFIGVTPFAGEFEVRSGLNQAYVARWTAGPLRALRAHGHRLLQRSFEAGFRRWGYSLEDPAALLAPGPPLAAHLITPDSERSSSPT
jgi:hypothetical protein